MSNPVSHDYRSVIALNNIGVSLLERGAFRQAYQTFKGAAFVLKRHLSGHKATSEKPAAAFNSSGIPPAVPTEMIKAMQRLSNVQPISLTFQVNKVSYGGGTFPPSSLFFIGQDKSLPSALPIEIETQGSDWTEDLDLDMVSGIVLLNFGIAHLCVSKVTRRPEQLRNGALQLFDMAYSIISSQQAVDASVSEGRCMLAAVVLNQTTNVLGEMGLSHQPQAQESYHTMAQLERVIDDVAKSILQLSSLCAAPAA
jgi:hypothetical protein